MSTQLRKDVSCKWRPVGQEAEAVVRIPPGDIHKPSRCSVSSSSGMICESWEWSTPPVCNILNTGSTSKNPKEPFSHSKKKIWVTNIRGCNDTQHQQCWRMYEESRLFRIHLQIPNKWQIGALMNSNCSSDAGTLVSRLKWLTLQKEKDKSGTCHKRCQQTLDNKNKKKKSINGCRILTKCSKGYLITHDLQSMSWV